MTTPQQKAFCVLRFVKSESVIIVQREFRKQFQSGSPCKTNILRWYRKLQEKGCICKGKSPGRPRMSEKNVNRIKESYARSPRKSLSRGSRQLGISQTTLRIVLCKRLITKAYTLQLLQALKPLDKTSRFNFCVEMHGRMEEDDTFSRRLIFFC
jgi:hypothetical protein